jgi:hypothetical protein
MKKFLAMVAIATLILSCSGDRGPMGPSGPQGPAGVNILGQVFEVNANFTNQNGFSAAFNFPQDIEVFESDVVLVYRLAEVIPDSSGPIDVWEMLPATYFIPQGIVYYGFNHTFLDVEIFMDGTADLLLTSLQDFTLDQVFRIAIVPADFAERADIDIANFNQVLNNLQAHEDFQLRSLN